MSTRVIVCGGKDFEDKACVFHSLDMILANYTDVEIVSGHAKGVDSLGESYAGEHSIQLKVFPADWKRYGKAAGPIRNREMLTYALEQTPIVVAFWNGTSRGTKDMITQAKKAGAEVHIISY